MDRATVIARFNHLCKYIAQDFGNGIPYNGPLVMKMVERADLSYVAVREMLCKNPRLTSDMYWRLTERLGHRFRGAPIVEHMERGRFILAHYAAQRCLPHPSHLEQFRHKVTLQGGELNAYIIHSYASYEDIMVYASEEDRANPFHLVNYIHRNRTITTRRRREIIEKYGLGEIWKKPSTFDGPYGPDPTQYLDLAFDSTWTSPPDIVSEVSEDCEFLRDCHQSIAKLASWYALSQYGMMPYRFYHEYSYRRAGIIIDDWQQQSYAPGGLRYHMNMM